jgi:PAS domain S-box-containing protein
MKLNKIWNSYKLGTKFSIIFTLIIIVLLSILGTVVIQSRKKNQTLLANERMHSHANELYTLLELNYKMKIDYVKNALLFAEEIFKNAGTLSMDSESDYINAVNQVNQSSKGIYIYPLLLNDNPILYDNSIVDNIERRSGVTATIFQRIEGGFLRIATTVRNERGERAIGTFIPDDSPVVQTIIQGQTYLGRAFVVNQHYITSYMPIYVDGSIEAMLYVGTPEHDIAYLESRLNQISYFENGYPMLIDGNGRIIFHPLEKGKNIAGTVFFNRIQQIKNGHIKYEWPEDDQNKHNRQLYFRYFEPYNMYVAASIDEREVLGRPVAAVFRLVFGSILFSIILLIIILRFMMPFIVKPINHISMIVDKLSTGEQPENYITESEDEIGKISLSLNRLITGLKETASFANEIEKKNFEHQFSPLSKNDVLGNALLDMRESLKKADKDEETRKQEDHKRNWATEGLAKFSDILRLNNDNLEELSFSIIKNLVKYLDANQGGVFVVQDTENNHKVLELTACYAYDRQKFLTKTIEIGEGITGTCFLEGETTYLKEIPQDYLSITSGLGDASPDSLLVVPLKLNEQIFGVIELASFNTFKEYEIEFVEKIAESIASTISGVKTNMRTSQLLEQSQQQAEVMRAQEEEMRQNMEELQATQENIEIKRQEQEKLQEILKREEALLAALLSSIPDFIYFKDKQSKFIRVSDSMVSLFPGYTSPQELVGKSDFDFHTPENAQRMFDDEQDILKGLRPPLINNLVHEVFEDGREQWVSTTKMPLKDLQGNLIGIWGISKIVTDFKNAELEAQAKSAMAEELTADLNLCKKDFRGLLDTLSSHVMLMEYTPDATLTNASQPVINLFGLEDKQIGKAKHNLLYDSKHDTDAIWLELKKGRVKKRTFKGVINKHPIVLNETYTPVVNSKGQLESVIAILVLG